MRFKMKGEILIVMIMGREYGEVYFIREYGDVYFIREYEDVYFIRKFGCVFKLVFIGFISFFVRYGFKVFVFCFVVGCNNYIFVNIYKILYYVFVMFWYCNY